MWLRFERSSVGRGEPYIGLHYPLPGLEIQSIYSAPQKFLDWVRFTVTAQPTALADEPLPDRGVHLVGSLR